MFARFYDKNIYQFSELFMWFLHYVITMLTFQADRLGCTVVQSRKFIYQSKLKICINAENVISSPDNETAKKTMGSSESTALINKIYKL